MDAIDGVDISSLWLVVLGQGLEDLQPPTRSWGAWAATNRHQHVHGTAADYVDTMQWLFTADFVTVAWCAGVLPEVARKRLLAEAKATWQAMPPFCRAFIVNHYPTAWPALASYVA